MIDGFSRHILSLHEYQRVGFHQITPIVTSPVIKNKEKPSSKTLRTQLKVSILLNSERHKFHDDHYSAEKII